MENWVGFAAVLTNETLSGEVPGAASTVFSLPKCMQSKLQLRN